MAGVVVSPRVAQLGLQADQIRKRIAMQLLMQQRQRAAAAQMQQQMLQMQQGQQPATPQVADPYAQLLQQQAIEAQDAERRKALLDAMQDQKGGA